MFTVSGYEERCQTNEYGKRKFHFCEKDSKCMVTDPPQDKRCKDEFFKDNNTYIKGSTEDEVLIMDEDDTYSCFRHFNQENKRYGWCHTLGDFYNMKEMDKNKMMEGEWGYCSRECYLDKKADEKPKVLPRRKMNLEAINSIYF